MLTRQTEILELLLIESNSGENCNPIYIDLQEGWNIIGYTLPEPQDVAATLESISSERFLKITMLMFIGLKITMLMFIN